jgi:transcriptional regulator with XRE-family HTH domain
MIHIKSVLAHNIKSHRKSLGWTQEILAEKVNTATTYIAMIESERRTPSFKMIERIAEVLKIEATELFSINDYPLETAMQIREDLISKFDMFFFSSVKEIECKKGNEPSQGKTLKN